MSKFGLHLGDVTLAIIKGDCHATVLPPSEPTAARLAGPHCMDSGSLRA
jgi:hypothetical protein